MLAAAATATLHGGHPAVPLWLVAPFALLLACIALMPFIHRGFWHEHYPDFAFALGGLISGHYLVAFRTPDHHRPALSYGASSLLHALQEYYAFIALVGGLFVVSGGILVDVRGRGRPALNTALLAIGAVLANIVGTTGASMLLIRPYMRINRGRLKPIHIVMFIFIISNCTGPDAHRRPAALPGLPQGCAVPLDAEAPLAGLGPGCGPAPADLPRHRCRGRDPAVQHDRPDPRHPRGPPPHGRGTRRQARPPPPRRHRPDVPGPHDPGRLPRPAHRPPRRPHRHPLRRHVPGPGRVASYRLAPREILADNDFSFAPVKEVALLFLGIFLTMTPALAYLSEHGQALGVTSPTAFYFFTGSLSAMLDNAPTYANFLQVAFGPTDITPAAIRDYLATPAGPTTLAAISTGAVFSAP